MATRADVKTKTATRKVVVNRCYGGFSVSEAGIMLYAKLKGLTVYPEKDDRFSFTSYYIVPPEQREPEPSAEQWHAWSIEERIAHNKRGEGQEIGERDFERDDPLLVEVIETLGDAANGMCAKLEVVEIPADVDWRIEEYDGREWVAEAHRTW